MPTDRLRFGPRATVRIPLRKPLDDLWADLRSDVARTPVRKARKQGLRLVEASTPEEISRFFALIRDWRSAQGLRPVPAAKYQLLADAMPENAQIFLADRDGEALGGAGIWHFAGRAFLFSPVQSLVAREQRVYAGDFLYWEMIRWCHARKFEYFDLSGVSPAPVDSKEKGIRRFKEKWGGSVLPYEEVSGPITDWKWQLAQGGTGLFHFLSDRLSPGTG